MVAKFYVKRCTVPGKARPVKIVLAVGMIPVWYVPDARGLMPRDHLLEPRQPFSVFICSDAYPTTYPAVLDFVGYVFPTKN